MANLNPILQMKRFFKPLKLMISAFLIAALFSGTMASPALADAPGTGTVFEGVSVPGVALGDTRAQVEAAWGAPVYCQNVSGFDQGSCEFAAEGGGQIFVRYSGPDGGGATASPEDKAIRITWHQAVSGWVTTAGINTTLAYNDPDAVQAAYPNAVIYQQSLFDWGYEDRALGIRIHYHTAYLTGVTRVSMAITIPDNSPPPEPDYMHVSSIDFTDAKRRHIIGTVHVQNEQNEAVPDALVYVTWTFPDGNQLSVNARTDSSGLVEFNIYDVHRGIYTLTIDDVLVYNYEFDPDASLLSATYKYKVK
ncbi:MAG TPA: Ig-like domain-containing protein [Anaerolineales bacterium]|nr:Ig-like domain-containing protein [Anaerolineales bacterium]